MIMPAIFERETYFKVNYNHLNDFIAENYSLDRFEGTLESPNDSTHEYSVDGALDQWHDEELKEFLDSSSCEHYSLGVVLGDMCAKGWIEPGKYLVRVSW